MTSHRQEKTATTAGFDPVTCLCTILPAQQQKRQPQRAAVEAEAEATADKETSARPEDQEAHNPEAHNPEAPLRAEEYFGY